MANNASNKAALAEALARQEPSDPDHQGLDYGNDQGRDDSPLDAAPPPKRRAPPKKRQASNEGQAPVQVEVVNQPPQAEIEEELKYEDDSPLDALAEAATAMCEVSREGPGTGNGWVGRDFDYGDGRGPQKVHYGRINTFPRTRGLLEAVAQEAGGGRFRFATKGKPVAFETLPGPPIQLVSEQGYPNGASPGSRGGFDRGQWEDDDRPVDPFDAMDPDVGIAPEEIAQNSLNGWYQNGRTGYWQFFVNGSPGRPPRGSKPPIPAAGFGAGAGMLYDHSEDDRIAKLEAKLEAKIDKIIEGGATGRSSPLDDFLRSQAEREQRREEREEQRRQDEREARREQLAAEKEARMDDRERERERLAAEKETRREEIAAEKEREERRATADREARSEQRAREFEMANTSSKNSVEMAKIKAEADKEIAKANAEILKAGSDAASRANERIIDVVMKKSDDVGLLTKGMQIAADMAGGKSTAQAITDAAEKLIPAAIDGYVQVRTMGSAGGCVSGAEGAVGASDDDMLGRMAGLLASLCSKQATPEIAVASIGAACSVSGFDVNKIDPLISIGTPATVAALLDVAAGKATDATNKQKMIDAKNMLQTDQGKSWFGALKSYYQAKRSGKPPAQIPGPGPASPAPKA